PSGIVGDSAELSYSIISCVALVETYRVIHLVETVPQDIAGGLLRHIVMALIGHHASRCYKLILLQVRQIDIFCPLLKPATYRYDRNIFEFVVGQIGELVMQLFHIISR